MHRIAAPDGLQSGYSLLKNKKIPPYSVSSYGIVKMLELSVGYRILDLSKMLAV